MSVSQQVLVNFEYSYIAQDGRTVSIKPNEHYILVAKTNENWWHVRQDETAKPFFIPAKYVTELPAENRQTPIDPPEEFSGCDSSEKTPKVTLRVPNSIKTDTEKDGHRISTYIIPKYFFEPKVLETNSIRHKTEDIQPELHIYDTVKSSTHESNYSNEANEETSQSISLHHINTVNTQSSMSENGENLDVKSSDEDVRDNVYENINTIRKEKSLETKDKPAETVKLSSAAKAPTSDPPNKSTKPSGASHTHTVPCESQYQLQSCVFSAGSVSLPSCSLSDNLFDCSCMAVCLAAHDKNMVDFYAKIRSSHRPRSAMPLSVNTQTFLRRGVSARRPLARKKVEDDSAVYVNLPRKRLGTIDTSSPAASPSQDVPNPPDILLLDSAGWEVHIDDRSGQEYYFQPSTGQSTWEYPLRFSMDSSVGTAETPSPPSFPHSPCSPMGSSPHRWSSDWEKVLDGNTGRHYFYNTVSGQSSWDPPEDIGSSFPKDCPPALPEEDYPASPEQEEETSPLSAEYSLINVRKVSIPRVNLDRSSPPGWTLTVDHDGVWVFTSDYTQEQWIKSIDDMGRTYYYTRDGTNSQWNLPEHAVSPGPYAIGNGASVEPEATGLMQNWRHSLGYQDEKLHSSCGQNVSDSESTGSPEITHNVSNLEKAGILNKTKVSENGKKVRKNWAHSWTVLHGGVLTFHKDPKSTTTGASAKTNQIVPEFKVDLKGATLGWATKDKSSKKNVLELKSRTGAEFLIQYDTESIIGDWHKVIVDTIRQLDLDQQHSEDEEEINERSSITDRDERFSEKRALGNATRQSVSTSASEADQKKVRTKLKKFLLKRPTLQSVKDKGYIRENVFGCYLHNLCSQERSTVPSFVEKCIRTVEKRGLGIDGLYRVSGNLAVIQKLRFKADHEDLDLEEGNWDIHVITGALKLFFRELQEPLFPYNLFNEFISGIKITDYYSKLLHMKNLVRCLPPPNHDTMEALFSHLRKVIQHGDENRMTVQNVAIVFGPTLLKPEVETANITMYMVFQNQIVEFLLNEFESIFHM